MSSTNLELLCSSDNNLWSGVAKIPLHKDVEFRYCVCIIVEADPVRQTSRHIVVRRWETNLCPRQILKSGKFVLDCFLKS